MNGTEWFALVTRLAVAAGYLAAAFALYYVRREQGAVVWRPLYAFIAAACLGWAVFYFWVAYSNAAILPLAVRQALTRALHIPMIASVFLFARVRRQEWRLRDAIITEALADPQVGTVPGGR